MAFTFFYTHKNVEISIPTENSARDRPPSVQQPVSLWKFYGGFTAFVAGSTDPESTLLCRQYSEDGSLRRRWTLGDVPNRTTKFCAAGDKVPEYTTQYLRVPVGIAIHDYHWPHLC